MNPPSGFKHKVTDNLQRFYCPDTSPSTDRGLVLLDREIDSLHFCVDRWVIEVNGAPGTLYANETFQLQVDFPEHYPMEAPQVAVLLIVGY